MAPKRKRQNPSASKGLQAGERLKRSVKGVDDWNAWGWVGSEVTDTADITQEHILTTCGLSLRRSLRACPNKYARTAQTTVNMQGNDEGETAGGILLDEPVVNISDDEDSECILKGRPCRNNPFCLNHLGQDKWEKEGQMDSHPVELTLNFCRILHR
jgi:hypothetical protein